MVFQSCAAAVGLSFSKSDPVCQSLARQGHRYEQTTWFHHLSANKDRDI